jgi:hypothetical protein
MSNLYSVVDLNGAAVIMRNGLMQDELTASVNFVREAHEVVGELNAKIKQVDDLTLMLTHALPSSLNVRDVIQRLQDTNQLTPALL